MVGDSLLSASMAGGACSDDGVGDVCKATKDCERGLVCDPGDLRCKLPVDLLPVDGGMWRDASAADGPLCQRE